MLIDFLLVGIGGSLGAVSRYTVSVVLKRVIAAEFPFSTFFINLTGSFLLGILLSAQWGNFSQLLLGIGFMGGFTTFSTFQVENVMLFRNRNYKSLIFYVGGSCLFCILFAILGLVLGNRVF